MIFLSDDSNGRVAVCKLPNAHTHWWDINIIKFIGQWTGSHRGYGVGVQCAEGVAGAVYVRKSLLTITILSALVNFQNVCIG